MEEIRQASQIHSHDLRQSSTASSLLWRRLPRPQLQAFKRARRFARHSLHRWYQSRLLPSLYGQTQGALGTVVEQIGRLHEEVWARFGEDIERRQATV